MIPAARVTASNYVSHMVSPFNQWFQHFGYPELDVVQYEDGEWAIIQFHRSPVVPALTPWSPVLTKMRHVELTPWVCQKYANQLDLEKRHVWDEQEKLELRARHQQAAEDAHAEDIASRMHKAITQNPALMERIARKGMKEINLRRLAKHIPNHFYR